MVAAVTRPVQMSRDPVHERPEVGKICLHVLLMREALFSEQPEERLRVCALPSGQFGGVFASDQIIHCSRHSRRRSGRRWPRTGASCPGERTQYRYRAHQRQGLLQIHGQSPPPQARRRPWTTQGLASEARAGHKICSDGSHVSCPEAELTSGARPPLHHDYGPAQQMNMPGGIP